MNNNNRIIKTNVIKKEPESKNFQKILNDVKFVKRSNKEVYGKWWEKNASTFIRVSHISYARVLGSMMDFSLGIRRCKRKMVKSTYEYTYI